jgi:hypothetical protein
MSSLDRSCTGCGDTEQLARLEKCGICSKYFCADCGHRAVGGRKFCSDGCAKAYYFHGDPDDDEDLRNEPEY